MKKQAPIFIIILISSCLFMASCGPIIISPDPHAPPTPPWFYPNRIEPVRYVYFPDFVIYYDLSARQYLFLENNIWMRVNVLPPRYRNIDLNRSKFVRIKGHRGSSITSYHRNNYANSPKSSRTSPTRGRKY